MIETITIPPRSIIVRNHCDVLVVGAGPAGFGAAVSAARSGARVTLVERFGMAGGLWTLGLVSPIFDSLHHGGLNEELQQRLRTRNALGGYDGIAFDPAEMALLLDECLKDSNVDLLLYSQAIDVIKDGNRVSGIVVANKSGLSAIRTDVVIDCTGDGDIAAMAGAEYAFGDSVGCAQPMTMMFRVGGLRRDYPKGWSSEWYNVLKERIPEPELLARIPYNCPAVVPLPRTGEAMIQWTHIHRHDGTDADSLSAATLEGRRQIRFIIDEVFPRVRDVLGDLYLLELPTVLGVRETRRITGDYMISDEDVINGKRFPDAVCHIRNGIDIHIPDKAGQEIVSHAGFDIPFRSLLVKEFDNLMTAGRCISGSFRAHAAYRVTGDCLKMGESAGSAAASSVAAGLSLRKWAASQKTNQSLKSPITTEGESK